MWSFVYEHQSVIILGYSSRNGISETLRALHLAIFVRAFHSHSQFLCAGEQTKKNCDYFIYVWRILVVIHMDRIHDDDDDDDGA